MKNKGIIIAIVVMIVIIMGWWLASPLFISKTVNEQLPIVADSSESINSNQESEIKIELQGSFVDADSFHKTSGTAKVVVIDGKKYLSLENFQTTNGPDLYIYLSKDLEAKEFVNLGELKGNIGNQNYEILESVDINSYNKAIIWCKAFSVLFGSAELN